MLKRKTALAFVAVGVLGLPAAGQAATRTVTMGPPPPAEAPTGPPTTDVNDYFPHRAKIHAGDKIKFQPFGFHNVEFPATGEDPTPLLSPTGATAEETDEAGNPFWFNGRPVLGFTPSLVTNDAYGKSLTYSKKKGFQSGLPLADSPKPFTMKFRKPGKYTYYCNVHFAMKGVVKVVRRSAKAPSAKAHRKAVAKQVKATDAVAKTLGKSSGATDKILVGDYGKGGVDYFDFVPKTLTVATGAAVTFEMPEGSREVHTATVGPGDPSNDPDGTSYLGQLAASFEGGPAIDPRALYSSDPPGTTASLTASLHGNGFWNTGVIEASADAPFAQAETVKFDEAGTFDFYCLVHPFMKATVTVQ